MAAPMSEVNRVDNKEVGHGLTKFASRVALLSGG